jgi:hypothetical protein
MIVSYAHQSVAIQTSKYVAFASAMSSYTRFAAGSCNIPKIKAKIVIAKHYHHVIIGAKGGEAK